MAACHGSGQTHHACPGILEELPSCCPSMKHPATQSCFWRRLLSPLQAVECAVNLLYNLGEGAAEELLHPGTGSIAQLVAGASALCIWHSRWDLVHGRRRNHVQARWQTECWCIAHCISS